jgi:ribonucleoside-diphosphate reductase alpha chain
VQRLPEDLRRGIQRHGIRNSHLLAIAPTGTISLLADNVSSGVEPIFAVRGRRRVRRRDGSVLELDVVDPAWARWLEIHGPDAAPPPALRTVADLDPAAHVEMQAALQPFVDGAISKTVNVPEDFAFPAFRDLYGLADARGLKGLTVFRPGPVRRGILEARPEGVAEESAPCCEPADA